MKLQSKRLGNLCVTRLPESDTPGRRVKDAAHSSKTFPIKKDNQRRASASTPK